MEEPIKGYQSNAMSFNSFNPIWTGGGGGGRNVRNASPLRFFLHNSKTPGDIEK